MRVEVTVYYVWNVIKAANTTVLKEWIYNSNSTYEKNSGQSPPSRIMEFCNIYITQESKLAEKKMYNRSKKFRKKKYIAMSASCQK